MSIQNLAHSDYLAHPAYGSSDIIKMAESFAYFKEKKARPDPAGRPLVVGNATHLMLQGHVTNNLKLAEDGLLIYKDGSSGTKGFREFQAANPKHYCIDQDEQQLCLRMVKALLDEPEVMGYLKDAIAEPSIITTYPNTKIAAKCKPDYLHIGRGVSINIKTAADASESGFLYATRDHLYDWQSVYHGDVLKQEYGKPFDEVHILVQKGDTDAECIVNIFTLDEDTLQCARGEIWKVLSYLPECEKTGVWPKNKAYLRQVGLPVYMRKVVSL